MCAVTPASQRTLSTSPTAAREAREFMDAAICTEHAASVLDDARLLVTELVANAIRHGAPPITLQVECDASAGMRVSVSDGCAVEPTPRETSPDDESGRGVHIVDLLSDSWGVQPTENGKAVWFRLKP
ncbi:anti-sigma regulatory factor (Ser/Thr protein kinase) [Motilibacter peucedani]|uniref:Anti-sigma regulatory factor (Ser/Thr protein kinase) n=1 Tax=Motilibacter peucedani TaxID=598650 RepID=A0A420XQC3_9ACTN|nr:ATP-binding protein [Motilibacter peucedani]RKS75459.1 anti-sigma regulatory factor (Ser/Thr protein kinase) [Motilibacter peucedani]